MRIPEPAARAPAADPGRLPDALPHDDADDPGQRDLAGPVSREAHHPAGADAAAGAREIGAGHLDHRIEPETRDEFGSLVEAFNTMAGELAASQRKLEHSRLDLERKNQQLDERRRYIETVLERIATGVVSLGADGQIETINGAALRLLEVDRSVIGAGPRTSSRARISSRSRSC